MPPKIQELQQGQARLRHTPVFTANYQVAHETWGGAQQWVINELGELEVRPRWRIIAHQGGTRSSKTYSLAQYFAWALLTRPEGYSVTLVRQSLPALKLTALRDFEEVLKSMGINPDKIHHKQNKTYTLPNGNYLEYLSVLSEADGQKIRGAKRTDLWCNEGNELSLEVWNQLIFRTEGQIFLDFNPSEEFHWIWDEVATRDDARFIVSTYLHNSFLKYQVIQEIQRLQDADPNFWKIYGLGQRGVSGSSIYTHWAQCQRYPEAGDETLGLDFGFNHPTALVGTKVVDGRRYAREYIYQSGLTEPKLLEMLELHIEDRNTPMFADAARPDIIATLELHGYNVAPANKSVQAGIQELKSKPLSITGGSVNLIKELKAYKWKTTRSGIILDEPVKMWDDGLDALRYAAYNAELAGRNNIPISTYQSFK